MKQLLCKILIIILNCSKLLAYYSHCTFCKRKRRKILTLVPVYRRLKRENKHHKGGKNHDK